MRAKRKIRAAGIPFRIPADDDLPGRIGGVLRVVYLVFTEGHQASTGSRVVRGELCDEAVRLARLLAGLCPDDPEVLGLLALLLLTDARRDARAGDRLVLLEEQDRSSWDHAKIDEGTRVLDLATRLRAARPIPAAGRDSSVPRRRGRAEHHRLGRDSCPVPRVCLATRPCRGARQPGRRGGHGRGSAARLAILDELREDSQVGRWHLLHARPPAPTCCAGGCTAEAGDA